MQPSLDIVIVNWNSGDQLRECLRSIADARRDGIALGRVIVADNGSTDGSTDRIGSIPLPLTLLQNGVNLGFGAACNRATVMCQGDYLLLLNPDTRIDPDALCRPVDHLARHPEIGIVGIRLVDDIGQIQRSCARFPLVRHFVSKAFGLDRLAPSLFHGHLMLEWPHHRSAAVDQVMGAYFLMSRRLFERLGGFDERFFLYFEDVDFALRAHAIGRPCHFMAEVSAYHRAGGTSAQVKPERIFYCLRSRIIYARKHWSWGRAAALTAVTILAEPISRLALALVQLSPGVAMDTLRAYRMLIADLPRIFSIPAAGRDDAGLAAQPVQPAGRH